MHAIVGSNAAKLVISSPDFKLRHVEIKAENIFQASCKLGKLHGVDVYFCHGYNPDKLVFYDADNFDEHQKCLLMMKSLLDTE